jgi:hypothetical protein
MVIKRAELIQCLVSSALLLVLAVPCYPDVPAIAPSPWAFVQGIDTRAFCKKLGLPAPLPGATLSVQYVCYWLPRVPGKAPHPASFTLAVYPTIDQAVTAFKVSKFEEGSYALDSPNQIEGSMNAHTAGAGDDFYALIFRRSPGTPKRSPNRPNGHCRLRRANVMLDFMWQGNLKSAVAFCKRVDALLQSDLKICPRGNAVPIPEVVFSQPRPVADDKIKVQYHVKDGTRIVLERTPIEKATASGNLYFWGAEQSVVDFATTRNVIFHATYPPPH